MNQDNTIQYEEIIKDCSIDELGKLFIGAVIAGDTDFANFLREKIKHAKPEETK